MIGSYIAIANRVTLHARYIVTYAGNYSQFITLYYIATAIQAVHFVLLYKSAIVSTCNYSYCMVSAHDAGASVHGYQ